MARTLLKQDRNQISKGLEDENVLSGKTVVIIDDCAADRKRLRDIYRSFGFRIVGEGVNGMEGISLVEKYKPDLISLDVLMPVMHGVEAMGIIRESGCESILIFVTALQRSDLLNDLKVGVHQADAVLSKSDSRDVFQSLLLDIFLAEEARRRVEAEQRSGQDSDLDESA